MPYITPKELANYRQEDLSEESSKMAELSMQLHYTLCAVTFVLNQMADFQGQPSEYFEAAAKQFKIPEIIIEFYFT